MYGGAGHGLYVAYTGEASNLKRRIRQHLVNRDSSVTTGTSATVLNPDYVTQVRWWDHPDFTDLDIHKAAESVASDTLDPALRSRRPTPAQAHNYVLTSSSMRKCAYLLFSDTAAGRLLIPTLQDALDRIGVLERRLAVLEERLSVEGATS